MFYLIVDTGVKTLQKIHMKLTDILILHACVRVFVSVFLCVCMCVHLSVHVCLCVCVCVLHVVVFTSYIQCEIFMSCNHACCLGFKSLLHGLGFFVSKSFIVYLEELSKSHSVIK